MKKYIPTFLFAIFIFGFFLADIFASSQEFSEMENRYLAKFSPPTINSVVDNSFTSDYETYVNDHFTFRSQWITTKSIGESLLLKTENNGIVYGKHNYMFDKSISIDESRLERNLAHVLEFGEAYPESKIYFSVVPSSYSILSDYLPKGLQLNDQLKKSQEIYDNLADSSVVPIDLAPTLIENKDSYIYYRTDHHWTTNGAYLAYKDFVCTLKKAPVSRSELVENTIPDFYGSYYSKAKLFSAVPDKISYFNLAASSVLIDGVEKNGLYDFDQFQKRDKYAGFLYNNNPYTVLTSGTETAEKNSKILIIKDSYGNSMAPFFLANYEEVHIVDLRYIDEIESLLKETSFNEIYVIYSFPNFSTDSNIIKLLPEE